MSAPPETRARWHTDAGVRAVGGAMLLAFGLRLALLAQPIARLDRAFIPDDTYYTLSIARSIARGDGPTADGTTLTSGFQPLLGFLMVPVYWLTDNLDRALRIDLFMLIVADTLIVAILAWVAFRLAGRVAGVVAAMIWAVSPVAMTMALGGLETSLAMLCEIGLVAMFIWANDRPGTRRWVAVGVISGLAVLARVDALLLVALLAVVQVWRGPRKALVPASIAAGLTLGPWWAWCVVEFGSPMPTSGAALHELATYAPFSQHNLALTAGAASGGPFGNPTAFRAWLDDVPARGAVFFVVLIAALVAIAVVWLRRAAITREDRAPANLSPNASGNAYAAAAMLPLFAVGLLLFYAWFGVWYFNTRYLAPVQIGVALAIAVLVGHLARRRPAGFGSFILAGALVVALGTAVVYDAAMLREREPRSRLTLDAATGFRRSAREVIKITPKGSIVAAYQSGALSYFGRGHLTAINLDGVVDPDAPSPDVPADTLRYMERRNVEWVTEWDSLMRKLLHVPRSSTIALSGREIARFRPLPYVVYRILRVTDYKHRGDGAQR